MRRGLAAALLMSAGLLVAACGSSPAAPTTTFQPAGDASASPSAAPAASASTAPATSVTMPPFGQNLKVVVDPGLPSNAAEVPAVITAKNFVLALLYSSYTGGKDTRWQAYVSNQQVLASLKTALSAPSVTTESFTGTIRLTHFSAVSGNFGPGTVAVSFCTDTSGSKNTSLSTGKVLPAAQQTSGDSNYYLDTYGLAQTGDRWSVIETSAPLYYPRAPQCKP